VVWRLPVVFVCENNLYMEYTPIAAVTAVPRPAADRAPAYGLEPVLIDGNERRRRVPHRDGTSSPGHGRAVARPSSRR